MYIKELKKIEKKKRKKGKTIIFLLLTTFISLLQPLNQGFNHD